MNSLLFWAYVGAISVLLASGSLVAFRGTLLFPRRQLVLLVTYFSSWAGGISLLLASELSAPYNAHFDLNPTLFLAYLGLVDCAMLAGFLLITEMHYRHVPGLPVLGGSLFVTALAGLALSLGTVRDPTVVGYPWTFYLAIECTMGLGIVAFALLALRSFQDVRQGGLLSREQRWGLVTLVTLAISMMGGLALYAVGAPFFDFSAPFNPSLTIGWLWWTGGSSVVLAVMVQRTHDLLAPRPVARALPSPD